MLNLLGVSFILDAVRLVLALNVRSARRISTVTHHDQLTSL